MFCKKVNIPYEVYAFSDHSGISQGTSIQKPNKNDLCLNSNLRLLNILSSKMNASQFSKAASVLTWVSKQPRWVYNPFTLGGTPLNDTILAAMTVVTDFKKDNRLQVVNTVFLTDGESNNHIAHYNENGQYQNLNNYNYFNGSYTANNLIIRDPVTRHEVSVRTDEQEKMTATFIRLLKYRTNSNIIGFYILNQHEANRKIYTFYPKQYDQHSGLCASFKKNKHLVVTSQGYDEYYLLKSDKRDDDDDTFEVKSTTTKSIVNAFSKYAGNKMNSRTVLNRFIGLIS
jgi:FtsZ-interacting cell division protein YlmF